VLEKQLQVLNRNANGKKESFDMESAVLFRCAKDFGRDAISVLQTVNKEDSKCDPYKGKHREQALKHETEVFVDYIFSALLRVKT
jgi:purine-nucleoside phosphorylase